MQEEKNITTEQNNDIEKEENEFSFKRMGVGRMLLVIAQGALVGVGAILPGISGGVMMVLFGIYRPVMELFSHPIKAIKKHIWLFLPFVIGCIIGFIVLAKALGIIFELYEVYAVCLFVGLIAGTIPMLWRSAGEQGRTKGSYISLVVSFIILLAVLIVFKYLEKAQVISITPNILWYFICGIVWGASIIIPGLSSSSILLAVGLYVPLMNGIGLIMDDFGAAMAVILPLFAGIALVAFGCAKVINGLFDRRYSIASHAVIGFVLASTVMIIPLEYSSVGQGLLCIVFAAVGFAIAWLMDLAGDKMKKAGKKD